MNKLPFVVLLAALTPAACGQAPLPPLPEFEHPEGARILSGRLLEWDEGDLTPVEGITLCLFTDFVFRRCTTDENGVFAFRNVPFVGGTIEYGGTDLIPAIAGGAWKVPMVVFEPTETQRDIVLMAGGEDRDQIAAATRPLATGTTISGRVLTADGQPIEGVTVVACGTGRSVATGVDGSFTIEGLHSGDHLLRVRRDGLVFPLLERIQTGSTDLEVRSIPGGTVAGMVRNHDGEPQPGVWVNACRDPAPGRELNSAASDPFNSRDVWRNLTDRDGRFLIGGLPDTDLIVQAIGGTSGAVQGESMREIRPGATGLALKARITHFESPFRIAGSVNDQDGQPVPGATVTFDRSPLHGPTATVTTKEDGSFFILGLGGGHYTVSATAGNGSTRKKVTVGDLEVVLKLPR